MDELKPCPFCGCEDVVIKNHYGTVYRIGCQTDGCKGWWYESVLYRTEAKAIEAWNTRAERTCKRVLFEPTGVLVCSECGAGMPKQLDKYCYLHYCPNCGAHVERREQ